MRTSSPGSIGGAVVLALLALMLLRELPAGVPRMLLIMAVGVLAVGAVLRPLAGDRP